VSVISEALVWAFISVSNQWGLSVGVYQCQ